MQVVRRTSAQLIFIAHIRSPGWQVHRESSGSGDTLGSTLPFHTTPLLEGLLFVFGGPVSNAAAAMDAKPLGPSRSTMGGVCARFHSLFRSSSQTRYLDVIHTCRPAATIRLMMG